MTNPRIRLATHLEFRASTLEVEAGHYLDLTSLMSLIDDTYRHKLWTILHEHEQRFFDAEGSSKNHQAWRGGYMDHVLEVMNIACQQYLWMNRARKLPFSLSDALVVLFLHDIEKPFKHGKFLACLCPDNYTKGCDCPPVDATKENRRKFRDTVMAKYGIFVAKDLENALRYVEGVPDSEYTPGERTMNELAAFVHSCDILSARLWHDQGKDVPAPAW